MRIFLDFSKSSSVEPRALTIRSTSSATTFSSVSFVHGWYVRGEKRAEGAHVCTLARTRDTTPVPAPPLLRAPFQPSIENETAWWRCDRLQDRIAPRQGLELNKFLYILNFYNFVNIFSRSQLLSYDMKYALECFLIDLILHTRVTFVRKTFFKITLNRLKT